jgi:hypothetical protein
MSSVIRHATHSSLEKVRLRAVLRLNAIICGLVGLAGAGATGWTIDGLGLSGTIPEIAVGLVGVGLVVSAIAVWSASASTNPPYLRRIGMGVIMLDLSWAAGAAIVGANVELSGIGLTMAVVTAGSVLGLSVLLAYFVGQVLDPIDWAAGTVNHPTEPI